MRARNTLWSLLTMIFVVVLASDVMGQDQKKPAAPAGKAQAAAPLRELFQDLDANGDRVIEKQEVPESGSKAFQTLLEVRRHESRWKA